ncbi:MAG: hypothetical protein LBR35_01880 [Rickettsiales bacterium]|nr:hypothetical protein [Rickettsiales bacterium]
MNLLIFPAFGQDFRALKDWETYVRSGPGADYPILFKYKTARMPVKILKSYEGFSQIQDYFGNKGWILDTKLRRKKTAYVTRNSFAYKERRESSNKLFEILSPNVVDLKDCDEKFCKVQINKKDCFMLKENLWGDL